jgi:hypothetical protein
LDLFINEKDGIAFLKSDLFYLYFDYYKGILTEEEFYNRMANLEYTVLTKTVNCVL